MIDYEELDSKTVSMRFSAVMLAHAHKVRKAMRRPDGLKQTLSRQIRDWALVGMEITNPIKERKKHKTKNKAEAETNQMELFEAGGAE